jgi:hypothetical protein
MAEAIPREMVARYMRACLRSQDGRSAGQMDGLELLETYHALGHPTLEDWVRRVRSSLEQLEEPSAEQPASAETEQPGIGAARFDELIERAKARAQQTETSAVTVKPDVEK